MWQFGFGGKRARILWQEHLQLWDSTDTVVEGPSEVESLDCRSRSTRLLMWNNSDSCVTVRILWQEHLQRWGSTIPEWDNPTPDVEPPDLNGGSTRFEWWEHVRPQRGATHKTLIIKDLLDFRVVIFTTLKSVKPLSIRQLRDAPGVYGNKKPL